MRIITPITITDAMVTGAPAWARASVATYFGSDGYMKTAAANVPRVNFEPVTETIIGLLVESAATNELTYSEDISDASWVKTNSSVIANTAVAPTNTTIADTLYENATSGQHGITKTTTVTNATEYVLSAYVKAGASTTWIYLEQTTTSGSNKVWFNLSAGTAGTVQANASAATITSIGNSWYRCSIKITTDSTSSTTGIYKASADNTTSYSGNPASTLFVHGIQLEATTGTAPSSYIPTSTVAVTRPADTPGTYNSVAEDEYTSWSSASVSYAVAQKIIYLPDHKIYSCVTAHTSAATNAPAVTTAGLLNWSEVSYDNRWAMFDNTSQTVTSTSTDITVVLRPGSITSLAILGLTGYKLNISMIDTTDNSIIYASSTILDSANQGLDYYDYFFGSSFVQKDSVILNNVLPSTSSNLLVIQLISTSTVSIGTLVLGLSKYIGSTQVGANVGIVDYSVKSSNSFGVTSFVQRTYSKRNSIKIFIENKDLNALFKTLSSIRATPIVWIGTDDSEYEPLVVFGYYKDFSIDIAYNLASYCSLEIEGLA